MEKNLSYAYSASAAMRESVIKYPVLCSGSIAETRKQTASRSSRLTPAWFVGILRFDARVPHLALCGFMFVVARLSTRDSRNPNTMPKGSAECVLPQVLQILAISQQLRHSTGCPLKRDCPWPRRHPRAARRGKAYLPARTQHEQLLLCMRPGFSRLDNAIASLQERLPRLGFHFLQRSGSTAEPRIGSRMSFRSPKLTFSSTTIPHFVVCKVMPQPQMVDRNKYQVMLLHCVRRRPTTKYQRTSSLQGS